MLTLARHAGEYLELTRLLVKHGGGEIAKSLGLTTDNEDASDEGQSSPETLARDIETLGPAYIKLAQIASTREDMIAPDYARALERLQDDVEPVSFESIRETIEEGLGAKINSLFATFDQEPLASASLGQVHRATLRDGRQVVVKVQRPGVEKEAMDQLAALRKLAEVTDQQSDVGRKFRFCSLVDAVEYALTLELDYRREAANLECLAENLEEFDSIRVPQPIGSLVSRRVLVMEHLSGTSLRDISGVVLNEVDTDALAEQIIEAYLKQILVDGLFHADPHPGNLLFTSDRKLGLIDGGMVVSISPKLRRRMASLLMAVSEQEGEEAARLAAEIGHAEDDFEMDAFVPSAARVIVQQDDSPAHSMSAGKIVVQLLNVAGEHGLVLPFELILFSKALLQVENTVRNLSPRLDVRDLVRGYAARLLMERTADQASLSKIARSALDSVELASELPRRLNRITELISNNALRVSVDAIDERELLAGVHKIANRITAGLVTSALIVGASLLMRIDAGPKLLGFPLLATVFFIIAAFIGLYLVWLALIKDE